jgi:N-acetylmuramoyl-L-alanine amidase
MKVIRYIDSVAELNAILDELTRAINWIIVHCTAGPRDQKLENIFAYWESKGWSTGGYHFMILEDGTIAYVVPINKPSNGVKGYNAHSINICYLGGVATNSNDPAYAKGSPIDNRTLGQKRTMRMMLEAMSLKLPSAVIQGHRDFSPDKNRNGIVEPHEWMKSCPSFSVADQLSAWNFKSKLPRILLTTTGVNIRTGPGIKFSQAAPTLKRQTVVRYLGGSGEWSYVSVEGDKIKGYVKNDYLKESSAN